MRAICTMLIAGAVISSAPRVWAEAELVNGIEAVVHDSVITHAEVSSLTLPAEQMLALQYSGQPELLQKKRAEARNDNLDQLMQRQLILHDFRTTFGEPQRLAIVEKMLNKDVDQELAEEIRSHYGGNRMALVQTLQAQGVTLERHRHQMRDRLIISLLRQKNIASEIIVSPHRIEAYYLAHREEFKVEEEVKLRMIVLKCPGESEVARTEKLAEDVRSKLKEGATFAEMATIHSEGSQRNQGGELGWWEPSKLSKSLADTALALQTGQHSGVLSRSAGDDYWVCQYDNGAPTLARHYVADTVLKKENMVEERRLESASAATNVPPPVEFYLMFVEDRRPARFKPLTEVQEQIENDLRTQEQARLEKQWVDRLKKKTFVRVFY